jgi:hypothetical protein
MQYALQPPPSASLVSRLFGRMTAARPRVTRWYAAHVQAGATRELTPPPGRVTLHCRGGEAWITHDGDPKDVMLRPNESHTVDRANRMTLHALRGDCVFEIQVDE